MQCLLTCRFEEGQWAGLPQAQQDKITSEYGEVIQTMTACRRVLMDRRARGAQIRSET